MPWRLRDSLFAPPLHRGATPLHVMIPNFFSLSQPANSTFAAQTTRGGFVAHAVSGDGAVTIVVPLAIAAVVLASWALRPPGRTLAA